MRTPLKAAKPPGRVANPGIPQGTKSIDVTDRALRYRANRNPPPGPELCVYCGAADGQRLDIDHVDGFEENTAPENLAYACRPCNTVKGLAFKDAGIGRPTRQFNPGPKTRAERLKYLEEDARRILAAPHKFKADEVRWAKDLLASAGRKPNPTPGSGARQEARTLGQWREAVTSVMGLGPRKPAAAVRTIQATPHAKRAAYARQLARSKNPDVPTIGQYAHAVLTHERKAHDAGGAVIHATPKSVRREYARKFAESRGARRASDDEVPF